PARPFPDRLRDDDLRPPPAPASRLGAIVWGTLTLLGLPLILLLAATLKAGCATNDPRTKASLPPVTPIMVPPAMKTSDDPAPSGGVWAWQGTEAAGERIVPGAPDRYTVEFQPNGRVQLRADCNRGVAEYIARGD